MEPNVGATRRSLVRWGAGALVLVATATSPQWAMAEGAAAPIALEPAPAGAEALRTKLVAALRADARAKLPAATTAYLAKMKDSSFVAEATARDVLVANGYLGYASRAPGDVEALVLVVLLEASKDAEQDLRAAMERVAEINRHKQAVRDTIAQCKRDRTCLKDAKPPAGITKAAFDKLIGIELEGGGLGPAAEANQLQVQMKMDRRRKLLETLSNAMKKMAQTSEGIVANLK